MENSYGIGVENKYALFLDDESDPFEALANVKKETEKKVKASGKENKSTKSAGTKSVKKVAVKEQIPEKDSRPDAGPGAGRGGAVRGRGGFGAPAESREERNNRRNWDDRPEYREGGAPPRFGQGGGMEGGERGRGRGRGGFGGRGRGRGRGTGTGTGTGTDYRGKREFDRQSGSDRSSGVKAVDKRDGSGRGNWGTVEDELAASFEPSPADESVAEAEPAAEVPAEEGAEQVPAEPEDPEELTLDEWKRQQEPRNKPQFNVRRAGEGENATQWKNTFELKKKREEDDDSDEEDESEDEEQVRHGRPKRYVEDIQFTFSDSRRGGGGRGRGRGGEEGGYRGGYRGRGRGEDGGGYRGRGGRGGEEGSRGGYRGSSEEGGGYRGGYRGRGRGGEEGGYRGRGRGGEEGGYRGRGEEGGYRGRGEEGGYRGGEEGGYRGGYRGARGGGEEGGPRGARGRGAAPRQQHAPKVDDENDFPSLG